MNKDSNRRYICRKDTVIGRGCDGVYITANLVKDFMVRVVMTRLYTPEMERALASSKHNPKVLALHSELAALDDLFIKLSEMVA